MAMRAADLFMQATLYEITDSIMIEAPNCTAICSVSSPRYEISTEKFVEMKLRHVRADFHFISECVCRNILLLGEKGQDFCFDFSQVRIGQCLGLCLFYGRLFFPATHNSVRVPNHY